MAQSLNVNLSKIALRLTVLLCAAVGCSGWLLVAAGMDDRFPGGDPGYGNLLAVVVGLSLVVAGGVLGLVCRSAGWRSRTTASVLLLALNTASLLAAPIFVVLLIYGAFDPASSPPPERPRAALAAPGARSSSGPRAGRGDWGAPCDNGDDCREGLICSYGNIPLRKNLCTAPCDLLLDDCRQGWQCWMHFDATPRDGLCVPIAR